MAAMNEPLGIGEPGERDAAPAGPGLAWLPLLTAIALTLGITIYPHVLTGADGRADHLATMLAMWAMSAGFVRGTGFVPRNRALRIALSGWACLAALVLAGIRLLG
ncbi:cyd operon YbgE family protein [Cognatazoarcus halotolerans]|uniref:cyd operon YbgE family protein n=1 Tax=Cognatazoarcus halotolerans TaxID=2686016 RepID=UPI001F2B344A|nr:cyd operon YbgE family protein [Cognatazoarcus halotolerans]